MYRSFETLVDPFPAAEPITPPRRLVPFLLHYARPVLPWLAAISVLTALLAVVELVLLSYLGSLVDLLATSERDGFLAAHGPTLAAMAALVVLAYPALVLLQSLLTHQTVFGNFPMRVRWLSHRLLLGQSMGFFKDEFAGRVAQKVMQTALAIRESVLKLMDVFVYIAVYFIGALVLVGRSDPLLTAPLLLWLAAYITLLAYYVPRLRHPRRAPRHGRPLRGAVATAVRRLFDRPETQTSSCLDPGVMLPTGRVTTPSQPRSSSSAMRPFRRRDLPGRRRRRNSRSNASALGA